MLRNIHLQVMIDSNLEKKIEKKRTEFDDIEIYRI